MQWQDTKKQVSGEDFMRKICALQDFGCAISDFGKNWNADLVMSCESMSFS